MLSTAEITERVRQYRYRPGWFLTVVETGFEDPWLRVLATGVMNSYDPQSPIDLGINSPIPPMETVDQLDRWIVWRLQRIESHEAREWLQVDGRPLFDPHRERDRV